MSQQKHIDHLSLIEKRNRPAARSLSSRESGVPASCRGRQRGESRVTCGGVGAPPPAAGGVLAVDGGTVCFGFPCRVDYSHETVSELLQDHPLGLDLRLVSLFRPLGLFQQTLACRLQHLLRDERIRKPVGGGGRETRVTLPT